MNEEPKEQADFGGCMAALIENAAFILGALLMFSKTVDLMSAFAPKVFLGYVGIEGIYGLAVGLMIEGMLVALKFGLGRPKNVIEWGWNILLILAPFVISALAQVFDSFVIRDTLSQQPQEIQVFVMWFVPSIPTLIVGLFVGKAILASIPQEIAGKYKIASIAKTVSARDTGKPLGFFTGLRERFARKKEAPTPDPTPASIKKQG